MKNPLELINKTILVVYFALAVATPLIFTTQTTELYEVPKMLFVYFCASLLFFLTCTKILIEKKVEIPKSKALIAFAALTLVMVASTLTSTDKFLSVFGYPTRLNGSLLSQFAYLIIFLTALVNLNAQKAKSIILAIVIGAVAVSIWGIPSHFNMDPTCFVLTNQLTSSCWQADFNPLLRIFSTMGQPNWLASYLVLVLPFSIAYIFLAKKKEVRIAFVISSLLILVAIVLTNSRSGLIGLLISLLVFAILVCLKKINWKILALGTLVILLVGFLYGQRLLSKSDNATPDQPTESGQIRLIVWQGAIDIFKRWPILGSGPETFVNSYYLYRPLAHNKTSEWEFFYNKAHNEFVNYLANTGLLGFTAFMAFLIFAFWETFQVTKGSDSLFAKAAISAFSGYLATIVFGFSVVATQTIFLLQIASLLTFKKSQLKNFNLNFLNNNVLKTISLGMISILTLYALIFTLRLTFSNVLEKQTQLSQSPAKLITAYKNALAVFPAKNPYLATDFAYYLTTYSADLENENTKQLLSKEAVAQIKRAIKFTPNNYLITQRAVKTYTILIKNDPNLSQEGIALGQKLTTLAPTYPVSFLTLAHIEIAAGKMTDAKQSVEKVLFLKPDYLEARQLLDQLQAEPLQ